jgi:hypothetical protein
MSPARDRRSDTVQVESEVWREVADAKRLEGGSKTRTGLKKLLAEAMLDNAALKDILGKV